MKICLKNFQLFPLRKYNINILSKKTKVSVVQRPGDSVPKRVTLIPGEGIGNELTSICKYLIKNHY